MKSRFTASSTDRALQCQYWIRETTTLAEDTPGEAAERGTRLHALVEAHLHGSKVAPPKDKSEAATWAKLSAWLDELTDSFGALIHPEEAVAWNCETGEAQRLELETPRAYTLALPWINGTADLFAVKGDAVHVWDLKTGKYAQHAEDSGQLRTLALAFAALYKKRRAFVHIVRARPRSGVEATTDALESWDLDAHALELRRAVRRVPMAEPTPGRECRFCRAACDGRAQMGFAA